MDNRIKENEQLAAIAEAMLQTKAENIQVFHTGSESPIADWVVICEGTNYTHIRAIADTIRQHFKDTTDLIPQGYEGKDERRWILLDYFDIIVHVMLPEIRAYYRLEEIFKESECITVSEDA